MKVRSSSNRTKEVSSTNATNNNETKDNDNKKENEQIEIENEINKINNLRLEQIESYLNSGDDVNDDIFKTTTSSKELIDDIVNSQNLTEPISSKSNKTNDSQQKNNDENVQLVNNNNSNSKQNSKLFDYFVQGKYVKLTKSDYEKFTRNGKWTSCEFFRFKTIETEKPCEFCKLKCKTSIENIVICPQCRHFAHKSLVKHHMFVCKQTDSKAIPCVLKETGVDLSKSIVCRFCHFRNIINRLPSLNRLQKYLVQFINNRIIYVNSVSKKTMLWRDRLADQMKKAKSNNNRQNLSLNEPSISKSRKSTTSNVNNKHNDSSISMNDTSLHSISLIESVNEKHTIKSNVLKELDISIKQDEIKFTYLEESKDYPYSTSPTRRGPRIKHVSRYRPTIKTSNNFVIYDFSKENHSSNKLFTHLNSLNNDKNYTQISWQSFITDLQPNFNLSALSNEYKQNILSNQNFTINDQDLSSNSTINTNNSNHTNQINHVNSSSKLDLDNENEAENQCYKSTSYSSLIVLNRNNKRRKTFNDDEQALTENLTIKGAAIHQRVTKTYNNSSSYFNTASSNNFSNNNLSTSHSTSVNNIISKKQSSTHNLTSSNHHHHHHHHKNEILNFNWDDYFEKNHKISTNQNFRLSSLQPSNMSNLSNNNQNSNSGNNLSSLQYENNTNDINNENNSNNESSSSSFPQSHLLSKKRFNYNLNSYKERFHPYLPNSSSFSSSNKNKDDIFNLINVNTSILTNNLTNTNNNNHTLMNSSTNTTMTNLIVDSKLEQDILDRKYLVYDVQIDYDLLEIWKHGLSVISYDPINLKSACFICASVGHEYQLIYCNVCCEPFHEFCLEDFEKPKSNSNILNWVCPACKFCEICKLQNRLLYCHECENCYHANCFKKSNYPKKASKKLQIWVCFNCFKCKSCDSKEIRYDKATYGKMSNYDFSLCFKCYEAQVSHHHSPAIKEKKTTSTTVLPTELISIVQEALNETVPSISSTKKDESTNQIEEDKKTVNTPEENSKETVPECMNLGQSIVEISIKNENEENELKNATETEDINQIHQQQDNTKLLAQKKKNFSINDLVKCPHDDHTYAISEASLLLSTISSSHQPSIIDQLNQQDSFNNITNGHQDDRQCVACRIIGDHSICGRLLPMETVWIHINCLLWSNEVYSQSHLIEQVQTILNKPKPQYCTVCLKEGATLKCNEKSCDLFYHFNCAYLSNCYLTTSHNQNTDQTRYFMYCPSHSDESTKQDTFDIKSSLIIDLNDEMYRKKRFYPLFSIRHQEFPHFLIGSLQVNKMGDLDTISDYKEFVCPIDYTCTRLYWSTKDIGKKVLYKCKVKYLSDVDMKLFSDNTPVQHLVDTTNKIDEENVDAATMSVNIKLDHEPSVEMIKQVDGQGDSESESNSSSSNVATSMFNIPIATTGLISKPPTIIKVDKPIFNKNPIQKIIIQQPTNKFNIPTQSSLSINTNSNSSSPIHNPLFSASNEQMPKILKLNSIKTTGSNNINFSTMRSTPSMLTTTIQQQPNQITRLDKSGIRQNQQPFNSIASSASGAASQTLIKSNFNKSTPYQQQFHQQQQTQPFNSYNSINLSDLHLKANTNDSIISPKSDRSDSSLNLKNTSSLINPLQSSFDDFLTGNNSSLLAINNSINTSLNSSLNNPMFKLNTISSKKLESINNIGTIKGTKKSKRPKENGSSKPTVAALLSASYQNRLVTTTENQPQQPINETKPSIAVTKETPSAPVSDKNASNVNNNESVSLSKLEIKIEEKITKQRKERSNKAANGSKQSNKLRDYFADDPFADSPSKNNLDSISTTASNSILGSSLNDYIFIQNKIKKKLLREENKRKKKLNKLEQENNKKKDSLSDLEEMNSGFRKELNEKIHKKVGRKRIKNFTKNYYIDVDLENSDNKHMLVFEIISEDGFYVVSKDINKAWKVIIDRVNALRQQHKQKSLSFQGINGVTMYGLNNKSVVYMLEQFDSIEMCSTYKNKYVPRVNANEKWVINLDGSSRTSKPYDGTMKKCLDPFHWLSSQHRSFSYINLNKVFNQQFLVAAKALISTDMCNSMKYRHLKEFSSNGLIVKCSPIHGRGLFTLVDIHQSQMIIEYAGEIIRHQLCDKREKFYESKGIGCYMFRIDEYEVIDATTKGNQARFINHSCDPNCASKVMVIQGQKHIVIFAQRFIHKGEELTYDYKFPKEDIKIQCLCKSSKCRKYLN